MLSVSQRGTSLPRVPSNLIGHTFMSNHDAAFCEPRRAFSSSHGIEQVETADLHVALLRRFEDDGLEREPR